MTPITVTIEEATLDPQYHHLHHAKVLLHLEAARVHFLAHIGHPMEQFLSRSLFPVVSKISVHYLREVKGGIYTVSCEPLEVGRRSLLMRQQVLNDKKKLCVQAEVECMIVDGALRKAIVIDEALTQAFTHRSI